MGCAVVEHLLALAGEDIEDLLGLWMVVPVVPAPRLQNDLAEGDTGTFHRVGVTNHLMAPHSKV